MPLTSSLYISNGDFTFAGQAAPGGGLLFVGPSTGNGIFHMVGFDADNIIWRYTKIAKRFNQQQLDEFLAEGDAAGANQTAFDAAGDIVFDHNSLWWNQDEGGAYGGAGRFTFSYNIVAEGLDPHSTGFIQTGQTPVSIDIHHSMFINDNHRNPQINAGNFRAVNNITYNTRLRAMQLTGGNNTADVISNRYKEGPLNIPPTGTATHEFYLNGQKSVYLLHNVGWNQPDPEGDQWVMTAEGGGSNGPEVGSPAPSGWQRFSPLSALTYPIVPDDVATLDATLLPVLGDYRGLDCAGNWVNRRTSVDTRLISQYVNNTGISSLLEHENESVEGGIPTIAAGTACTDSDLDGMPDEWEIAHGLNPNNAADRNGDINGDGYTNLEKYLNGTLLESVERKGAMTGGVRFTGGARF